MFLFVSVPRYPLSQRKSNGSAHGIRSCSHAAQVASYETTSALATLPSPEVGMGAYGTIDASSTGLGATCNGQAASGLLTGPQLLWHINCLELWAVHLALRQFRPLLLGKHVLVRTDNTAAVSYINRLGGIRSRRMSQLARHLLLWSHTQFKSMRAVYIPGKLNRAGRRALTTAYIPRRMATLSRLIWSRFGEAQVDLFASHESSHCFTQVCISPSEPTHTDTVQAQGGRGATCWLHRIGPPGPGFPNSFPSRQHLPGVFL